MSTNKVPSTTPTAHESKWNPLPSDAQAPARDDSDFSTVDEAIEAIKKGWMVIIADDEDRENEGDLVCAAEAVTPDLINFMATEGRGLICLTMMKDDCDRLMLDPMVVNTTDPMETAFTVTIDAAPHHGVTTGISAADRAKTIQLAVDSNSAPEDFRRPGHIFPLRAKKGGVLERVGQTEASADIARLAGFKPAGVICEIMNADGSMSRRDDLASFAKKHDIPFITVAQLIHYRLQKETMVKREAVADLPTKYGDFKVVAYRNMLDDAEHLALVKGDLTADDGKRPLVRVHSECLTGDVLTSLRCDCGDQLQQALKQIDLYGKGALIYMRTHEGRGIGLTNKIKAYELQDKGMDTVQANIELGFAPDLRHYGIGAQIMSDIGIKDFDLLTNNPGKIKGLDGYGLNIIDRIALHTECNEHNAEYMRIKQEKMGHMIDHQTRALKEEQFEPVS